MIGRLRQVLSGWACGVFIALFILFEGPVLYLEWRMGRPLLELKFRPGTALIYLAAASYGMHRAVALHPFYHEHYRKWLAMTPWTVHKPLRLGRWHRARRAHSVEFDAALSRLNSHRQRFFAPS
jgi:hypothetical protein